MRAPIKDDAMALEVRLFPCLQDNYGYLVRDGGSGRVAAVDAPDGSAVLADLEASGWGRIDLLLNTHWHGDHTGGNAEVKRATGCEIVGPAEVGAHAALDRTVADGDRVALGETVFEVIATGGHTLGHVSFYAPGAQAVFTGDSLFALGCGRLFEGAPAQMWESLSRLAALPGETHVWCGHEYTAANARFALTLDTGEALAARAREVFARRERGQPTLPSTIALERATNPFLRAAELVGGAPVEAFAKVRALKDGFRG